MFSIRCREHEYEAWEHVTSANDLETAITLAKRYFAIKLSDCPHWSIVKVAAMGGIVWEETLAVDEDAMAQRLRYTGELLDLDPSNIHTPYIPLQGIVPKKVP